MKREGSRGAAGGWVALLILVSFISMGEIPPIFGEGDFATTAALFGIGVEEAPELADVGLQLLSILDSDVCTIEKRTSISAEEFEK